MLKRRLAVLLLTCLLACARVPSQGELDSLTGEPIDVAVMEAEIAAIMEKGGVPGVSAVILNDSRDAHTNVFGVKNRKNGQPLDVDTIFAGARTLLHAPAKAEALAGAG